MPSKTMKPAVAEPPFTLVKWYLDCVTEPGETAILYCADLRWRGIHASYSSVLLADGHAITTQSSMKRHRLLPHDDHIVVEFPQMNVSGTWKATAAPVQHTMYEESRGSVLWNCLQPGSFVHVTVGDCELNGLGYAECLTLDIASLAVALAPASMGAVCVGAGYAGLDRLDGPLLHQHRRPQRPHLRTALHLRRRNLP